MKPKFAAPPLSVAFLVPVILSCLFYFYGASSLLIAEVEWWQDPTQVPGPNITLFYVFMEYVQSFIMALKYLQEQEKC